MQLPLVGSAVELVENLNPSKSSVPPGETESSIKTSAEKKAAVKAWWARFSPEERKEVRRRHRSHLLARHPNHDRESYEKHKATHYQSTLEWKKKHPDKVLKYGKKCYEKNRDAVAERRKEIREADPERFKTYERESRERHRDERLARQKEYYRKLKSDPVAWAVHLAKKRISSKSEKRRAYFRNWARKKRAACPEYRIHKAMMNRISEYMGYQLKRSGRSLALIGCTVAQLKSHLESLWDTGMSWDNYGNEHLA